MPLRSYLHTCVGHCKFGVESHPEKLERLAVRVRTSKNMKGLFAHIEQNLLELAPTVKLGLALLELLENNMVRYSRPEIPVCIQLVGKYFV